MLDVVPLSLCTAMQVHIVPPVLHYESLEFSDTLKRLHRRIGERRLGGRLPDDERRHERGQLGLRVAMGERGDADCLFEVLRSVPNPRHRRGSSSRRLRSDPGALVSLPDTPLARL